MTTRCITTLPALERELAAGLMASWKSLVQQDPLASCFQSPGWCMPWYRSFHDEFDPCVVAVSSADALVGLVPLAIHRSTGEIAFASGTMADYRDVVAAPGFRAEVVDELLRIYLQGRFPNSLQIGWIDPQSDTPALVARACRARNVRYVSWQQPCYRWTPAEGENLNKKFSRIRTHLNHFKRLGDVTFDVVAGADAWTAFRDAFFEQHSLRQLQADRPVSFDDARKRRFYDRLVDSSMVQTHVTALRLDGQLLSGHIGLVWRDTLMLGAPSISIEHEQRSPALILLSWVMQNASSLGLQGFDLTIGDTEFKRRLGNHCVAVTSIEVFGRRRAYYAHAARRKSAALAKRLLGRPVLDRIARHAGFAREHGVAAAIRDAANRRPQARPSAAPREITRDELDALGQPAGSLLMRENRVEDLLRWKGTAPATVQAIRATAKVYARQRALGATFHTVIADEQLAAWCYALADADTGNVTVSHLHVTPEFSARGGDTALLARVSRSASAAGATRVLLVEG